MATTKQVIDEHPITKIKISDLVFDPTNPNIMSDEQMKGLKLSFKKFGYLVPLVVDLKNRIADGEHRAIAYKELGLKEIPAIKMKLETDADRRELRQVLNKLHGSHNLSKDADELVILFQNQKLDELAEIIARPAEDMRRLINRFHPGFDPTQAEDKAQVDTIVEAELNKKEPKTKPGDIIELGQRHRLICGDSTNKHTTIYPLLKGEEKIDQLNCDPPYGVAYGDKNKFLNNRDEGRRIETVYFNDEATTDYTEMFSIILQSIPFADYNTIYIWSAGFKLHEIRTAFFEANITWGDYLVWVKNNHVLGRKDYNAKHEFCIYGWKGKHKFYSKNRTTVFEFDKPQSSRLHPTMKPIELIKQTIEDGSKEDSIILDTFAGSGTSLIAAEQTNRKWRGIELDPWYCDVIIKRYEKYTGKEATRLNK